MIGDLLENGIIESADIVFSRGFILDCQLTLTFDGTAQGFGGYVLGGSPFDLSAACAKHDIQANIAADFIGGVMAVADVDRFSKLTGKVVRVRRESAMGKIVEIGHPVKDRWYNPEQRMALLSGRGA